MSDQKPPPTVVQQTRSTTQNTFIPGPPTPRPDVAFQVTPQQSYVPSPPNQTGNQGPAIRGMAPTGQPNQSSIPPNSDLNVSQMTQSMSLAFVQHQPVRGGTQNIFPGPPPQTQTPRMANHPLQGQPVFPLQSAPFFQPMPPVQPPYCMSCAYGNAGQRHANMIPQYYSTPTFATLSYPQPLPQTQSYMNYQPQYIQRGPQTPIVASTPQNLAQVPPPPMPPVSSSQQQMGQKSIRAKAISTIDSESGKDKLDEIFVCHDSHPASGESPARQTPRPSYIPNKEVPNVFPKQVNVVINYEKMEEMEHSSSPTLDQHIGTQSMYQSLSPNPEAVQMKPEKMCPEQLQQLERKINILEEFIIDCYGVSESDEGIRTSVVPSALSKLVSDSSIHLLKRSKTARYRTGNLFAHLIKRGTLSIDDYCNGLKEVLSQIDDLRIDIPGIWDYLAEIIAPVLYENAVSLAQLRKPFEIIKQGHVSKLLESLFKLLRTEKGPSYVHSLWHDSGLNLSDFMESSEVNNFIQENQLNFLLGGTDTVLSQMGQWLPSNTSGKSKQRNKDAPKQTQAPPQMVPPNLKQNLPVPVPQTQPAKPNNKTNKMRELNMKGANKEGTDMDAFNDNTLSIDTVVVTNTNTTVNDIISNNDVNVNDSNKNNESSEILTIKDENKTLPKKVDVTNIVKDVPKSYITPVVTSDETDRNEYDNDKIVQAKNEANTKVNTENDSNIIEFKPSLPYKEGQWSPSNTSGKKVYDKDFLLALKNDPKSRKKPENLLETIAQGKIGDVNRYPMHGKQTDFTSNFGGSNYSGKSLLTQRSTLPKRNSQQGKSGGNTKGSKSSNVIRCIPVRGDVKLNERANMSDDQKKTQPQMGEPLGVSQMFDTWGQGSNIKTISSASSSANMLDALENIENVVDKISPMNPYHSRETSLERNYKHTLEDGRGSRSSSQHRSPDNSQQSKPISTSQQNILENNPPSTPKPGPPQPQQMSSEQLEQLEFKINILEEFIIDCYGVSECDEGIHTSVVPSALSKLVSDSSIRLLKRSKIARYRTGNLFAHLIKRGTLSIDDYCNGLKEVLSQIDDLRIDIPGIWDYLAEIIAPVLYENAVSLAQLRKPFEIIKQDHVSKLLESLFKLLITEKGPSYVHSLWHDSGLNLSDFMESSEVNNFIQENQLNFLLGGTDTVLRQMGQRSPSNTSGRKVYDKDFLLALKNDPKSRKKPENLLQTIAQGMKSKVDVINKYPMPGKPTDFRFNFNGSNYSGKSFSTKVNTENDSNIIEFNPGLPYKEGQWSPSNTSGKKVYDKDFLLALKNDPKSRKKPDNLLETIAQEEKGKVGDINRYPMGGKPTDFTPNFSGSNYSGKSLSTQRSTQIDEPLGFSQMFGTWGRGSNIETNSSASSSGKMFAALENTGNYVDKRSPMDGRGSRSSSQHRSPDNSQQSKPMSTSQQNMPENNSPSALKLPAPQPGQISSGQLEQLERKIKNILEEYLSVNECNEDIRTSLVPSALSKLVSDSFICVLERSKTARSRTGNLFAHLLKRGTLSIDNYCNGLKEVLRQTDDLRIDIPRIWDYLAEIIAPVLYENAVTLAELRKPFEIIKQGHASKLLESLFKLLITEKGPSYVHSLWHHSGLNLSDFMESSEVNNFIQENQLNFLLEGTDTVLNQSKLTYEEIHKKLLEFFANDNSVDDIYLWIQANIGKRINEKQFVRTLATAVFEDSVVTSKLKTDNLRKHYTLLIRIVDGHPDYELECLYALQALINRLEHPQGILLSICGFLYDDNVLSRDSFKKWESSDNPAEQEGKGAVLKQLTSFFTQLTEVDEETSSTEEA